MLITTFFSKIIATEEVVCGHPEDNLYTYCKTEDVLTSVRSRKSIINNLYDNLTITDKNIFEISDYAFDNNLQLGNLTLNFGFDLLYFSADAFIGLDNLTVLNINNGRVLLKNDAFRRLPSLELLKLEANEDSIRLYEFLPNLENLTELELLRVSEVKICPDEDSLNKSLIIQIEKLRYTTGRALKELRANSFYCLKNLNYFSITQTNLETIEEGAFNGLDKIENLILTKNSKLRQIPVLTFDNFVNSIDLDLNSNSIEIIEVGAFNSKRSHFVSIDLSSNKLSNIKSDVFYGVQCEILDLSSNKISTIEPYAFNQTKILGLFVFDNPLFDLDGHFSELSIFTTVYNTDSLIFIRDKVPFNCTLVKDEKYEVCFHEKSLKLVREMKHDDKAKGKSSRSTLEVSRNITSIEEYTFYNLSLSRLIITSKEDNKIVVKPLCANNKLKLISLEYFGGNITQIQANAFTCLELDHFTITNTNLKSIAANAFNGLINLTKLNINNGRVILKNDAFRRLPSLELLKLEADESSVRLYEFLSNLENLNELELLRVDNGRIQHAPWRDIIVSSNEIILTSNVYDYTKKRSHIFLYNTTEFEVNNTYERLLNYHQQLNICSYNSSVCIDSNTSPILKICMNEDGVLNSVTNTNPYIPIEQFELDIGYNGTIRHAPWRDIIVSPNEILLTNQIKNCSYKSSVCINSKTSPVLKICINKNAVLFSVKNTDPSVSIEKFELDIGCIETIGPFAFIDSKIKNELTIKSYVKTLSVQKNAFSDLQNLTNLQFIDSQVQLTFSIFKHLSSLESLVLSTDETNVPLCNVLTYLRKLSNTEAEEPGLVCGPLENNYYTYCKTEDVLTSLTSKKHIMNDELDTLIINDRDILEVSDNAFDNNLQLGDLTLKFGYELSLNENSFAGLDNLTSLYIDNGRVILRNKVFEKLTSLKTLKFEANERDIRLNEFLPNLKSSIVLELLRTWEISICRKTNGHMNLLTVEKLYYTLGRMINIQTNSFICLKDVNFLSISQTHLRVIEVGAFDVREIKHDVIKNEETFISSLEISQTLTSIDDYAFYNLSIRKLVIKSIPNNQIDIKPLIQAYAFTCLELDHFEITNTTLTSIDPLAFTAGGSVHQTPWQEIIVSSNNTNLTSTDDTTKQKNHIFLYNATGSEVNYAFKIFKSHQREVNSCLYESSVCIDTETSPVFKVCINSDDVLTSVTNTDPSVPVEKFNLDIDFDNKAFSSLPNLTYLRFSGSVVQLNFSIFDDLLLLETLILSIDESNELLCEVLTDLPSLLNLEIIDCDKIRICDRHLCGRNNVFRIEELFYSGGTIAKIQNDTFKCYNNIQEIEATTFELMNANLLELSLRDNKLNILKKNTFSGLKCSALHLSSNDIGIIEDGAFTNSQIEDLYYFDNPEIDIILDKIDLSNLTKIHRIPKTISVLNQQSQANCKSLCLTCDIICETTASKIATKIQNQEMMNINLNNNKKFGIDKHAIQDDVDMGNCKKYCAKCPVVCN
ncbi:uncharacterized protein LOC122853979 [Aphidius gifuensis]|uniref:uncharacterized protein LOC122853979 n=1 Tax=Aphidius gifuensis TaxID=684658 RepID=UPI001CDB95D6|nr:uncharacterized protein LOC122853979 [Aphidius gifuensis]